MGDPTRILILLATEQRPMTVAEVVEAVDVGQSTVSHHLKILGDPELAMGGDLLKKTGAGNLFMVFGEPDVEFTKSWVNGPPEGELGEHVTVEIRGVDVYDPTTGEVRSGSTDDIACWFVDTNCNGESFFVRHAYSTGGNDPSARLRRALRADIDEDAWRASTQP